MKAITEQSVYKTIYYGYSSTYIYHSGDHAKSAGIRSCFSMTGFQVL